MAKRHKDALAIQDGACNPSGIALAIVAACKEIRDEPGHTGTAQITSDPAVRLMVYQLAYICNITQFVDSFDAYQTALDYCRAKAVEGAQ